MSAASPNYVYNFGKKRPDAKPPAVMTKERIEEAKKNVSKYLEYDFSSARKNPYTEALNKE